MRHLKIESLENKNVRYYEMDEVMLHACFQVLKDFVENELMIPDLHELEDEEFWDHLDFYDKCIELYYWWIERNQLIHSKDSVDQEKLKELIDMRLKLWV